MRSQVAKQLSNDIEGVISNNTENWLFYREMVFHNDNFLKTVSFYSLRDSPAAQLCHLQKTRDNFENVRLCDKRTCKKATKSANITLTTVCRVYITSPELASLIWASSSAQNYLVNLKCRKLSFWHELWRATALSRNSFVTLLVSVCFPWSSMLKCQNISVRAPSWTRN